MKILTIAAGLSASLFLLSTSAHAQVGVSLSVGDPGFYGRLDIGGFPPPPVVNAQPVIIAPPAGYVAVPPVYLRVPLGYQSHWRRYCARYNACGVPVFFVQDSWYLRDYAPRYHAMHLRPEGRMEGRMAGRPMEGRPPEGRIEGRTAVRPDQRGEGGRGEGARGEREEHR